MKIKQSEGFVENLGIKDQRIFNLIFCLITGVPNLTRCSGHDVVKKLDLWDYPEGVSFFRALLFGGSK